jgi:glutathione S-transferase
MELYYRPGAASLAAHAMLEEVGAEHRVILVTGHGDDISPADYGAINPHPRVPTLVDGDLVVYEAAAVLMHLADTHPAAALAPALGSAARADWYRWMAYLTNTVQATFMLWIYPERYTADPAGVPAVELQAERDLTEMREFLEAELAGRDHLLDEFSTADLFLFMVTRWGRNMDPRWWDQPNLGRHYRAIRARPAVARTMGIEQLEDDLSRR